MAAVRGQKRRFMDVGLTDFNQANTKKINARRDLLAKNKKFRRRVLPARYAATIHERSQCEMELARVENDIELMRKQKEEAEAQRASIAARIEEIREKIQARKNNDYMDESKVDDSDVSSENARPAVGVVNPSASEEGSGGEGPPVFDFAKSAANSAAALAERETARRAQQVKVASKLTKRWVGLNKVDTDQNASELMREGHRALLTSNSAIKKAKGVAQGSDETSVLDKSEGSSAGKEEDTSAAAAAAAEAARKGPEQQVFRFLPDNDMPGQTLVQQGADLSQDPDFSANTTPVEGSEPVALDDIDVQKEICVDFLTGNCHNPNCPLQHL